MSPTTGVVVLSQTGTSRSSHGPPEVLSSGPHSSHSLPSAQGCPGSTPAVVDGAVAIHISPEPDGCSTTELTE